MALASFRLLRVCVPSVILLCSSGSVAVVDTPWDVPEPQDVLLTRPGEIQSSRLLYLGVVFTPRRGLPRRLDGGTSSSHRRGVGFGIHQPMRVPWLIR